MRTVTTAMVTSITSFNDVQPSLPPMTPTNGSEPLITNFPNGMKVACLCIGSIIALSNFIILLLYSYSKVTRKQMDIYLLNLTVVDFLNGVTALPITLFYPRSANGALSIMPVACCLFLVTWPQILYSVAYQSVLLVTIKRYVTIIHPFLNSKLKSKWYLAGGSIVFVWICSIAVAFVPLTDNGSHGTHPHHLYLCKNEYVVGAIYLQLFLATMIVLPLLVIVILYILMYRIAKRQLNSLRKLHVTSTISEGGLEVDRSFVQQLSVILDPSPRSRNPSLVAHIKDQLRHKRVSFRRLHVIGASRAAKTTCIISFSYISCWLPFITLLHISSLCKLIHCADGVVGATSKAVPYAVFLAFLGCAINPVIYIYRNESIKTEIRKICRRCQYTEESVYHHSTRPSRISLDKINFDVKILKAGVEDKNDVEMQNMVQNK